MPSMPEPALRGADDGEPARGAAGRPARPRADISAARWRIEAATRDVDAARAQFYPNINITAFVGLSSIGLDRLLRSGSEQYGAGRRSICRSSMRAPARQPARQGLGPRSRDRELQRRVVDAVRDVADQLGSLQSLERQRREQTLAQTAAELTYDLATQRYRAGLGTYLTVLNAEASVLTARRLVGRSAGARYDTRVALIRALGGGYVAPATPALLAERTALAQP
jgi:outer membrane protein TolC